jgi:hypothetical protein
MTEANQNIARSRLSLKRALWRRWLFLWPASLALFLYPVSNTVLRTAMLICFLLLGVGLIGFNWKDRWLRISAVLITVLLTILLLLPGRNTATRSLRQAYLESLRSYEGTRYVWGGENRLGIDCSGLIRKGWVDALALQGLKSLNPALLRQGLFIWWHDYSARALGEQYLQLTTHILDSDSVNQVDYAKIQPGDFAVTVDGIHVLAYLGNEEWIEADPDAKRVLRLSTPSTNPWFNAPIQVMRWTQLDSRPPSPTNKE